MTNITPSNDLSEIARLGDEIYEQDLKPQLEASDFDRLVAIEVSTRAFALGDTVLEASDALQRTCGANPEKIWILRVGSQGVYHILNPRIRSLVDPTYYCESPILGGKLP